MMFYRSYLRQCNSFAEKERQGEGGIIANVMHKIPVPYFRQNPSVAQNGKYSPSYKCKK